MPPTPANQRTDRRGMAIVLVLAMLAIAMGVSYALVHSQATTLRVQSNGQLRERARQAATTGLAAGLRKMHESSWAGADSTFTGRLSANDTFRVTYQPGDPSLTPGHANEGDWPYRVTLSVTGYAVDAGASTTTATHQLEAVVRLEPVQLGPKPSVFNSMVQYTLYQTEAREVSVELPCQIAGSVRLQDRVRLCETYPTPSESLTRYLWDLNRMRSNGYGDYRPFTGPLYLPTSQTPSSTRSLLTSQLGVTLNNTGSSTPSGWSHPGALSSYRLYPGGPSYSADTLPSSLTNAVRQPNPRTNPAGVFVRSGDLDLYENVTIRGTLLVTGKLRVRGANVRIESTSLTPLASNTQPIQLPAAVVGDDIEVRSDARCTVRGVVATWKSLLLLEGTENTSLDLEGRVICRDFAFGKRSEWDLSSFMWSLLWSLFGNQAGDSGGTQYYPVYLGWWGRNPAPNIKLKPETSALTWHWLRANDPVYAPGSSDVGLRWSLLRWTELR